MSFEVDQRNKNQNQMGDQTDRDLIARYGLEDDPKIRMGFIRKVFGILTCQLVFTALIVGACMAKRKDPKFVKLMSNPGVLVGAIAGSLISMIALVCCKCDKTVPLNYILLTIFTLCESVIVGHICMRVPNPMIVCEAAALTGAMVTGIFVYACCSKTDFTVFGPLLFELGLMFCVLGIFIALFAPGMHIYLAFAGVILFGFYLIIDVQLLVSGSFGGHRKYQIDEDSYIMGAMAIYMDIINIFLYILEIMN